MVRKDIALVLYQESNNRAYFSKILYRRYRAESISDVSNRRVVKRYQLVRQ